jgi:hypothetical protein
LPATAFDPVIEDKTPGSAGGDPNPEATERGIPVDPVALLRRQQTLDDAVAERLVSGRGRQRLRAHARERAGGGLLFAAGAGTVDQCLDFRGLR